MMQGVHGGVEPGQVSSTGPCGCHAAAGAASSNVIQGQNKIGVQA